MKRVGDWPARRWRRGVFFWVLFVYFFLVRFSRQGSLRWRRNQRVSVCRPGARRMGGPPRVSRAPLGRARLRVRVFIIARRTVTSSVSLVVVLFFWFLAKLFADFL